MKTKNTNLLTQNKDIVSVFLGTAFILMIPFVAMQFSSEMDWSRSDFVIIGALLLSIGLTFVFASRKIHNTGSRIVLGAGLLFLLIWIWAELAVGIFTNWGS